MRQFDVCRNPNRETAAYAPYLLILQADLLDQLSTCVVAPLLRDGTFKPITKLNPVFEIESERFILSAAELAGVQRKAIGEPVVSLMEQRDKIIAALDLLFTGI